MKFKSWMEMHIVRPKKKTKKDRGKDNQTPTKKNSDILVSLPQRQQLDSAGNSPTSPQLPKRQPILLPEIVDHGLDESPDAMSPTHFFLSQHGQFIGDLSNANYAYCSPFRMPPGRGMCACACFNEGYTALTCTCYPAFEESCSLAEEFRRLHSIRTSFVPLDQLQDGRNNSNLNSPRQRSRIRTNPWLTPSNAKDLSRALRANGSGSECGSASDESSRPEPFPGSSSESQSSARHSFMSVTTDPEGELTPSDVSLTSFHSTGSEQGSAPYSSSDEAPVRLTNNKNGDSSDSDECETLELGHFEENYDEYERETDILDDDTDDEDCRRPYYNSGRTPTPTPKLFDDKIEFADGEDEAYAEGSPISEDGDHAKCNPVVRITTFLDPTTPTDSACPSDGSDLLSPSSSFESSQLTTPTSDDGMITPTSIESATASCTESNVSRTLGEIRESLEEKVRRLRMERLLVEEKIQEARDEERLRREEKIKFQKQLILHRRQILLRTLQHLRDKLEDQSVRLQDAYSATLEMQLQVRRQLKSNPSGKESEFQFAKTSVAAIHEAPF